MPIKYGKIFWSPDCRDKQFEDLKKWKSYGSAIFSLSCVHATPETANVRQLFCIWRFYDFPLQRTPYNRIEHSPHYVIVVQFGTKSLLLRCWVVGSIVRCDAGMSTLLCIHMKFVINLYNDWFLPGISSCPVCCGRHFELMANGMSEMPKIYNLNCSPWNISFNKLKILFMKH